MRHRASAVIVKDNKILLIHRIKPSEDYYVFPGGGVEKEETAEAAMVREVKEELSLDAVIERKLFEIEQEDQCQYFYLIKKFSGIPKIGGEELLRSSDENQYIPEWLDLSEFFKNNDPYLAKAIEKLSQIKL